MARQAILLEPGEGRSALMRGTEVGFKVTSDDSERASLVEFSPAPGFDTGLHVHQRLEETFYVLDGEIEFRAGDETFLATPGACVFVPAEVPHGFANRTERPAKTLLFMAPATHDRYFDELAEILAGDGAPDGEAIADLRRRYDTEQLSSLAAR